MINYKLILIYIVEAFFMLQVGIGIFKLTVDKRRMFYSIILYGLSIYCIRIIYDVLGIPLGTHSIILFVLFSTYNIFICKISTIKVISMFYILYTMECIAEWTITLPIINKYNLIVDQHFFRTWQGIGVTLTSNTFLIVLTLIFWIKSKGETKKNRQL